MNNVIGYYNNESKKISELHHSIIPHRLYELIKKYFIKGKCLDIGCGIGRDTKYLYLNYVNCIGIDASKGMLEIARGKYKEIEFRLDSLPKLDTIDVFDQYDNILCSAVLMLFDEGLFEQSINTMARILKDDGVLVISLRDKIESDIIDIFNYSTPLVFRVARDHDLRVVYHERMKETNRDIYWSCYVIKRCSSKK